MPLLLPSTGIIGSPYLERQMARPPAPSNHQYHNRGEDHDERDRDRASQVANA